MKKVLFVVLVIGVLVGVGYQLRYPIFDVKEPSDKGGAIFKIQKEYRFAVSIDNTPSARPQAGLSKADLIIEAPTEASFTRLLVFFQSQRAERIGPVRSARPYFLDWAQGWDSIFVHSGGSKEALEEIEGNGSIKNIDEFFNEDYIRRDRTKPAPHNLFTSSGDLADRAKQDWAKTKLGFGWPEKEDAPAGVPTARKIDINFNNPVFDVAFEYDPVSNSYLRFIATGPHKDSMSGIQLQAKNIIVLETSSTVIDGDLLTIDLVTLGSGKAVVFRDGEVLRARWRRSSKSEPIQILDADGTQVRLNRGQTWIEVLDQTMSFSFE